MLQKGRSQRGENEMKYEKTTLMAGIAALSLFAGSGLASAQDSSKSESSKGATPHATRQMNQDGMSGHSGQNAQTQERGARCPSKASAPRRAIGRPRAKNRQAAKRTAL
jgi:hypothetical protein